MANNIQFTLILVVFCVTNVFANDFGFPEEDDVKSSVQSKKPVFVPQRCNENELFYPGDQNNDYVCDCKPGYLYHPKTDLCYSAYRQGPCQGNQYLMVRPGQYIPECMPNRCSLDGYVYFNNKCYQLNEPGPCALPELSYVLAVNSTTLELECSLQSSTLAATLASRVTEDEYGMGCWPGSRRFLQGKCVIVT